MAENRSLIVAADVRAAHLRGLGGSLCALPSIGGAKFGFVAGYDGLRRSVDNFQANFGKTVCILDHQKGATDTHRMAKKFAETAKRGGCHAVILYPLAGPLAQTAFTKECQDAGLTVLIGAVMTHGQFLESEGGYVSDNFPIRCFEQACREKVRDFVVPGNNLYWVQRLCSYVTTNVGTHEYTMYAPGFEDQGGDITACARVAGLRFHPIVGGFIYNQPTPEKKREAAMQCLQKLFA